jgi:GTP-binding protein
MSKDWKNPVDNIKPLLDTILKEIPEAPYREGTPQMQIASLDYSSFVGRIAIGRVYRGDLHEGHQYTLCQKAGNKSRVKIKELFVFSGLGREKVSKVRSGDLCALVGLEDFEIGDTIADPEVPESLPRISIDEPTMSMLFLINNSPFYGQEGKFVTSRHLRDRLLKETEKNLALRVEETATEDRFMVYGRGVLHLSVLLETMRREGYELQVGKPQVILKEVNGIKCEPFETLVVDVPENYSGKVIEQVTRRKGEMLIMEPKGDLLHLEFNIPSRGLIGLRNVLLTLTAGEVVMNHRFSEYARMKDEIKDRYNGSLVSSETGQALAFSLDRLQDRGKFFIDPGDKVYKGQVIGENNREGDLEVNIIKAKKLTNIRAVGSDDAAKIAPKVVFSLEEAMEYIKDDEYLEITPKSIRMRKTNTSY